MNIPKKAVLLLAACVAAAVALVVVSQVTSDRDNDLRPHTAYAEPAPEIDFATPYAPAADRPPAQTKRDKETLDLVCANGAALIFTDLRTDPDQEKELNDHLVHVRATEKGVYVAIDPLVLDEATASLLVNRSVGANVPPAFGESQLPADTILLTKDGFGPADILELCWGTPQP